MPRPAVSGYERLAQEAQLSDSDDDDRESIVDHPSRVVTVQPRPPTSMLSTPYGPVTPSHNGRPVKRLRSNSSGVDIKAINARLERWSHEIANKFKFKKGRSQQEHPPLEIVYSVFVPPEGTRPLTDASPLGLPPVAENIQFTQEQFDEIVESVRLAIRKGIDPKLIKQGSSGSYFMRDSDGNVVGVFKPKDEEPYGKLNPKMMKWLHRTLFPCFFGRACLIPNLSYISEAAACLLDRQLKTFLVPYTDVVKLSSKSFHYDYWDRRAYYKKHKPLPSKVGSFQVFLKGFQGLRRTPWASACRPSGAIDDDSDEESHTPLSMDDPENRRFVWTEQLQQNFREELEKLVILDYIMRNTDRGLDNWMIKEPMVASSRSETPQPGAGATVTIGAIDNSLAFPWKHPDQWRSFPFGWLFLPVSLIGQPFSQKTRDHFLPILTSAKWWAETQTLLRRLFEQDSDFKERMFQRQIAVLKGQAFNVVETLKTPDQGPLELTRRTRVHVWDDEMEVPVAVPLRVPTASDTRRRREHDVEQGFNEQAEMDIGAAASSAPLPREIDILGLGLSPPRYEIPSSVRLGISRTTSIGSSNGGELSDQQSALIPGSPQSTAETAVPKSPTGRSGIRGGGAPSSPRPQRLNHKSFDASGGGGSPRKKDAPGLLDPRRRRFSLTGGLGGPPRNVYNDDDAEGDLGYSAVGGSEGAQRKVIVERLEAVKSRNPVFTWC
ncbi:phosphatidylinositol 3 and 4-kinase-domain-containing protein [Tuber borchii]|uniref:Phosphatidylinositol 4-kinase n=1 Tax=Tuber borchii TaxID=42251 RepID=A0A2T7A2Q7_TUBBO|nr:phosphatidylinositol 3 and 4-kinase-domain-containing protein [Tuber borchii]